MWRYLISIYMDLWIWFIVHINGNNNRPSEQLEIGAGYHLISPEKHFNGNAEAEQTWKTGLFSQELRLPMQT